MGTFSWKRCQKVLSLLLAVFVLALPIQGTSHADGKAAPVPLAEWKFASNPTDLGVFPATGGVHQQASNLQPVPPRLYYDWDNDLKAIRYQGWHPEAGKEKYWLASLSTKGYHNIALSSAQLRFLPRSKGEGRPDRAISGCSSARTGKTGRI